MVYTYRILVYWYIGILAYWQMGIWVYRFSIKSV